MNNLKNRADFFGNEYVIHSVRVRILQHFRKIPVVGDDPLFRIARVQEHGIGAVRIGQNERFFPGFRLPDELVGVPRHYPRDVQVLVFRLSSM